MRTIIFLLTAMLCPTLMAANTHAFKLDNGLKVIVKEDSRAPVAVSMLWYNVGSADETGGTTGISHALEHLMFKGTPKYPLGVFSKTIASLGGQENAFTSTDYTAYFEKIATKHLDKSLALEADRMQHLLLDPEEFKKEMKVIQEERRMRTDDNPQALAYERFLATAHLASPYHHPVIGWMTDIEQLTVADIRLWYDQFYAPNNATLVIVGDVKEQDIRKLAQKHFGHIPKKPPLLRKKQPEPPALGKKQLHVEAPAKLPLMLVGYTVPSLTTSDTKTAPYTLEVIAALLDGGHSGRLNERIIRGNEMATALSVDYNLFSRYQTQFIVFGVPSSKVSLEKLSKTVTKELELLKKELVSEQELARVKTQLIAQKTYERDSIFSQAMELGMLETVGLGWQEAEAYEKQIRAVTASDIQRVANAYFNENRMTEAHLLPSEIQEVQ